MTDTIVCPVCDRSFESQFALEGHVRLRMDPEHVVFRQQQKERVSASPVVVTPVVPCFSGDKLVDILGTFITDQEQRYGAEAKTNEIIRQLKGMVEGEREIERKYQDLLESEASMLEQRRETLEAELRKQYQQDVDSAVAQKKTEWEQTHQKEIEDARAGRKIEDISYGYRAASLYIPDPSNGQNVFVQPGSPLHNYIVRLVNGACASHPEYCQEVFKEQYIFILRQKLKRGSS